MKKHISILLGCSVLGLLPVAANQAGAYSGDTEEAQLLQNGNFTGSEAPQKSQATVSNTSSKKGTSTSHKHHLHQTKTTGVAAH